MKRRWIVLLLLFMMIGAAGDEFTSEAPQQVQRTSSPKVQIVYLTYESEKVNPLQEDQFPEVNQAIKEHFEKMKTEAGYVDSYDDLHVYTKIGKEPDTYVAFVTYNMKIRGIYTKVPGLATFYVEKNSDRVQVIANPEDTEVQHYITRLTKHQDVQTLFQNVNEAYNQALQSDALLREALNELQNAYGS